MNDSERPEEQEGREVFLSILGHELRGPLNTLGAAAELLTRTNVPPAMIDSARRVIERQTRLMSKLLDDLQDVSRVRGGKIKLEKHAMDLTAAVERVVDAARAAKRLDKHAVSTAFEPVTVEGDVRRIEQVVEQLLANALKFTPAEGCIDVRTFMEGNDAVLEVRDSGIGIDADRLTGIFDMYANAARPLMQRSSGMGIGLTLVERLVALHGGTVVAVSEGTDRGSTFSVRIPRSPR